MNPKEPMHFSDYFNIDKAILNELGVFDPILNFDTKVFVEPLLLKNSASEIIRNSYQTYKNFFASLLLLLKKSTQVGDKCWRIAQKMVFFPEYQYSCIGYSSGNTDGRGSGIEFNDKIFQSAKEIVELAQDDPEIFLLLPLLEEGIAGDRISDMAQNIIDDEICRYTIDIMAQIGLRGSWRYETRNYKRYYLLQNPFSKHPIKLLPKDILSNLPVADNVGSVVHELVEFNERLRTIVSRDIGHIWLETTKSAQKEMLLKELKTNKAFFIETLKALKDYSFEHYDLEKDYEGLYKWLENSQHYINVELSKETAECPDNLDSLTFAITSIIHHFKELIENKDVWRTFWTRHYSEYRHVRVYYSQMLFFTVCHTWLTSQNSNISINLLRNEKQLNLEFSISNENRFVLHIKHANNPSLVKGYTSILEKYRHSNNEKHGCLIMNFEDAQANQLREIKIIENQICKIFEIDVTNRNQEKTEDLLRLPDDNLDFLQFEDMLFEDDRYISEKRKGGANSYQLYKPLRTQVEALCLEELHKNTYVSAAQLCQVVANRIVGEFPQLLDSFQPYKNHSIDGRDWTSPTFYRWCNEAYNTFNNKSELPVE